MDNQNNPNQQSQTPAVPPQSNPTWPPSPNPTAPASDPTPVQSEPTTPNAPTSPWDVPVAQVAPTSTPDPLASQLSTPAAPIDPVSTAPDLSTSPWLQPPQTPALDPMAPSPNPLSDQSIPAEPSPSPWSAPPAPVEPAPLSLSSNPTQALSQPPVTPEPIPTPPEPNIPQAEPTAQASPLDNPWGSPTSPPPLDGNSATPTWMPSTQTPVSTSQPTILSQPEVAPIQQESAAPTDLSHLLGNNTAETTPGEPTVEGSTPETLVVPPQTPTPDAATVPTEAHKSIPKWLIGVGIGLLIVVAGASFYLIAGGGRSPDTTTSLPAATQAPSQVKPPTPIVTPLPTQLPVATGSANFGALEGSGTQQATSAADILRQRQGQ